MKKVVSATLAGALAVGMVPAMALADDSVELQALSAEQAVQQGQITATKGATDGVFVVGDDISAVTPVTVTTAAPANEKLEVLGTRYIEIDPTGKQAGYTESANSTIDGKKIFTKGAWAPGLPSNAAPGNYAIQAQVAADLDDDGVVEAGETAWCYDCVALTILPADLKGDIVVYERAAKKDDPLTVDPENLADVEFVYDANPYKFESGVRGLAIKVNGKEVTPTSISAKIYDAKTNKAVADTSTGVEAAGDYYVEANFSGVYKNVYFSIQKLDLAKADIELDQIVFENGTDKADKLAIDEINGKNYAGDIADLIEVAGVNCNLDSAALVNGEYTVTIGATANGKKDPSIIDGTQDIAITVVGDVVVPTLSYLGVDGDAVKPGIQVDRTVKNYAEFDASKLSVATSAKTYVDYDLVVEKWDAAANDWVAAELADISNPAKYGTYKVKAVLDAEALKYAEGGESNELIVETTNGTLAAANVAFAYKGVNVDADDLVDKPLVYSGKDAMGDLAVQVKTAAGVVPEADYSVVVKKWSVKDGKYVATEGGIVDAGKYEVTISSSKYAAASGHGIEIVVNAVPVVATIADQIDTQDMPSPTPDKYTGDEFIYTGDAIDPVDAFHQLVAAEGAELVVDGKPVVVDVPASAYKVTITYFKPEGKNTKPVLTEDLPTEFKAAGEYQFTITDTDTATVTDNYAVKTYSGTLTITAMNVFADVPVDAWYADEVLYVAQKGWITGYSSNGLFGPNDGMKRGDLAVVLARYLKTTGTLTSNIGQLLDGVIIGDSLVSIDTGFSDVKGGAYYARAIKAMNEAGIMTGYEDGTYGPEDLVTRQQLATILARVEASGLAEDGATLLAAALADYADADEVAGWAKAGVEWAVENEIMGVDTAFLNPTDTVTRAEVAAMLVRYDALA